jgi:hypothetical protein
VDNLAAAVVAFGLATLLALGGVAAGLGGSTGAAGLSRGLRVLGRRRRHYRACRGRLLRPASAAAVLKVEHGFDNTAVNECSGALAMAQFLLAWS